MNKMKIVLCILTLNEIECLQALFDQIPTPSIEHGFDEIVAIDGGSTDGTIEFFEQKQIKVIGQSKRGRGEAFHLAFSQLEADAFLFFSPDGNEAISDLKKFRLYLENGADIVIASRMMKESVNEEDAQLFKWRKWANNIFNLAANLFFNRSGKYITDSINGYRAITKSIAEQLELDAHDYTIEYQMTMRALKARCNVVEFPTIEGERIAGNTGAPSIPTGLRFIHRFFIELMEPSKVKK
jgi:glycosyltransferase involved in cell wall biosynthesis